MNRYQRLSQWATAAGIALPLAVAAGLIPVRDLISNANVAMILMAVVVGIATVGGRMAAVVSAVSAAVWFDFFHTRPYLSFSISKHDDLVTAVLLLIVGIVVGELTVRSRQHRDAARAGSIDIARIHAIAEMVADGESPDLVVLSVATELTDLLSLRDCRFERAPIPDERPIPRIERSGDVTIGELQWGAANMGLPGKQVALPVYSGGRNLGRFVLRPSPGFGLSFDQRVVAVALADQAGAALAAEAPADPPGAE